MKKNEKNYEAKGVQPCPKCGSESIKMERVWRMFTLSCGNCGWFGGSTTLYGRPRSQEETNEIFLSQMKTWNKLVANELGEKRAKPVRLVEVERWD